MTTVYTINPGAVFAARDRVPLLTVTSTPRTDRPWMIVGSTDTSGARDTILAAVSACGWTPPITGTVHVTPVGARPGRGVTDLAIATTVLIDHGRIDHGRTGEWPPVMDTTVVCGGLGVDGTVRPVRGLLAGLVRARQEGMTRAIVPATQVDEARLVSGLTTTGVGDLADLVRVLHGGTGVTVRTREPEPVITPRNVDVPAPVADALMVAAAGHHHVLIISPPADWWARLGPVTASLLPPLGPLAAQEVAVLRSLAGQPVSAWPTRAPWVSPPPGASMATVLGGDRPAASLGIHPGAVSLATHGVLALPDITQYDTRVLEVLDTPLSVGMISLGCSDWSVLYPASGLLVATMRSCPCGTTPCTCTPAAIRTHGTYWSRIPGPTMDRIPLRVTVDASTPLVTMDLDRVRDRVAEARGHQSERYRGIMPATLNSTMDETWLRDHPLPDDLDTMLTDTVTRGELTARGRHQVAQVARTLSDLDGTDLTGDHVHQAMVLRGATTPADPETTTGVSLPAYTRTPGDDQQEAVADGANWQNMLASYAAHGLLDRV